MKDSKYKNSPIVHSAHKATHGNTEVDEAVKQASVKTKSCN